MLGALLPDSGSERMVRWFALIFATVSFNCDCDYMYKLYMLSYKSASCKT